MTSQELTRRTVEMLLAGDTKGLQRQAAALSREVKLQAGDFCPDCSSTETESNGHSEHRCCACDHRWGYDNGERYGF